MFTDRFIRLPGKVPNELFNSEDVVTLRICPDSIESYYDDVKDNEDVVVAQTKSGDWFYIYLPIKDFEKRLNEFDRGAEQREFINVDTAEHSKLNMP